MPTSTQSGDLPQSPTAEAKARLARLEDLFSSQSWLLFQEELARVRVDLLERAVATDSSEEAEQLRWMVKGLDLMRDKNFEPRALQEAGQRIDKQPEVPHYMALDSADQRRLANRKEN